MDSISSIRRYYGYRAWGIKIIVFLLVIGIAACANVPKPAMRTDKVNHLAERAGWSGLPIATTSFVLQAYLPDSHATAEVLTIYIEGDGLAWINSTSPSPDPTPVESIALKLALKDSAPAAYLARPCQYGQAHDPNCTQKCWTSDRYSPEVISATNQAVDQLKEKFNAKHLILVGYSGGGAVAALVAAQRQDIEHLITIAGNLDHHVWTSECKVSPLSGSLNPADFWQELQDIPQTHFVGARDRTVNESVTRAYAAKFPDGKKPNIILIPGFDHRCCWVDHWPALKYQVIH